MHTRIILIFLVLITQVGFCSDTSIEMQEKFKTLGPDNSFVFVDLGLTHSELNMLDQIKIETYNVLDRYGNLDLLKEEMPNFLRELGNDDEELIQFVTKLVYETSLNVAKTCQKETAWVSVRAWLPNHNYDMPRWHIDGLYYKDIACIKFATVLKGNPTLFYPLPKEMREEFNLRNISNNENREFLSKFLDINKAVTAEKGIGAFFIVGDDAIGAVHSEPKIDGIRLFFSVLPGNEDEIEEFHQRNLNLQK